MPTVTSTESSLRDQLQEVELMSLYPVMESVADVIAFTESRLPITTKNEAITLLRTYHNTLLNQLSKYK
jgi:hypothetical protein